MLVLLAFMGYVGAAVYGAIQLKPGMKYVDLVLRSSYYYKYSSWDEKYFGQRLAIAYVVDQDIDYAGKGVFWGGQSLFELIIIDYLWRPIS